MQTKFRQSSAILALTIGSTLAMAAFATDQRDGNSEKGRRGTSESAKKRNHDVQVGVRPFYLVEGMDDSPLKTRLQQCEAGPFYPSNFSISHRGAPMQFPEHTRESYQAAVRMGAGIIECDVSFTKDGELVCRHSECDLHTTTNIVNTPLNQSCTVPWTAGAAAPKCCTSDVSLAEFKSLKGKMDASNPSAATAAGYLGGTPSWRTDVYNGRPAGNVVTLKEHIELVRNAGLSQTPELKEGDPARIRAIFGGQQQYAQKLIDTYKAAGIDPGKVHAQSFNADDVIYWARQEPEFGAQAIYLDPVDPEASPPVPRLSVARLQELGRLGVTTMAPPIQALLAVNDAGEIIPSQYANDIKAAGFQIVAWSFERTNLTRGAAGVGGYYQFDPEGKAIKKDSDMVKALDVLARGVGVKGVFSDWPGTVTYYANCMGLR